MRGSRRPQRRLRFQRPNHSVVIEHVNALIQSAKPGLMRKQLSDCDLVFVCLPKLGPELRDAPVKLDLPLLQRMQHTRAANSLRCRPDQHDRVGGPQFLATGVAKSAVEIDNWFSVLPDRNRRAELATLVKVLLKQRFQSLAKFFRIELHLKIVARCLKRQRKSV